MLKPERDSDYAVQYRIHRRKIKKRYIIKKIDICIFKILGIIRMKIY